MLFGKAEAVIEEQIALEEDLIGRGRTRSSDLRQPDRGPVVWRRACGGSELYPSDRRERCFSSLFASCDGLVTAQPLAIYTRED